MAAKVDLKTQMKNTVNRINSSVAKNFMKDFEANYIPEIVDIIMQDYDDELVSVVTDRNSRTNPLYYRDEFLEALNNFEYLTADNNKLKLVLPDMENFDWTQGRLRIIEQILEGTSGVYVEVDENQYVSMYDKRPQIAPYDKTVPAKERIYVLRYTADLRNREIATFGNKILVRYPFSNTPPIDIFNSAESFVNDNLGKWVADVIKDSIKENSR
jgi:hypothetical protein